MANKCTNYIEDIEFLLEQINMKVRVVTTDKAFPKYVITKRDLNVDTALENVPELAEVMLSYLDVRNLDDLIQKRIILKQIADYLEPQRSTYKGTHYKNLCDDLFKVFNSCGIRHNNEHQISMNEEQRKQLYDATFKAAVCLLQTENIRTFQALAKAVN